MPYKRVDPVPVQVMEITDYEGHFSICQKLRDIYHSTDDEKIRLDCRIAVAMAKSMQNKLKYYKENTK